MNSVVILFSLFLELLRLINRMGGADRALAHVRQVNGVIDQMKAAGNPEDEQNAAEAISRLLSGR